MINGHVVISPTQKNDGIQTDAVKVIPLTPAQRRMKQKGIKSNHASPASSHGSTEFLLDSPTVVPCPIAPEMKQTSTPINVVLNKELIRPIRLDVKNNDTSTDEGRHTGESNPPTPVRNGTPNELSTSPQLKESSSSPVATNHQIINGNHGNNVKQSDVAMRKNGARLQQGEDGASSGCWSETESAQLSSGSDITIQHAPVMNALQHMLKRDKPHSPVFANSAGHISPIVDNRPLISSSAVSCSSVSINSKLSTMDFENTASSLYGDDDDDRFQSPTSSVVNVTLHRSNSASTSSLNNTADGGTVMSAAAMLKKSRNGRLNATRGLYGFMNYEVDPLEPITDELPRAVKNRRSTRGVKHRGGSKKHFGADDTISVRSMVDSSPQNTDADANSAHSGGILNDTASLCDSMYSVDQDGYYTSIHEDCGISKSSPTCTVSVKSMHGSIRPVTPNSGIETVVEVHPASPVFEDGTRHISGDKVAVENRSNNYNSYNRAVNSNHSTPKSLLSPRGKSASVKPPKPVAPPASDFQSELNKRLSVKRTPGGSKSATKHDKRRTPPPPPKRASSLSSNASPSPSSSVKSLSEREPTLAISAPVVASPGNVTSPARQKVVHSPEEFYKLTPPPPPPIDQLPPPPPELLETGDKTAFEFPHITVQTPAPPTLTHVTSVRTKSLTSSPPLAKSSTSSKTSIKDDAPYHSIAMQAAMLGSRMSQNKKESVKGKVKVKSEPAAQKHEPNCQKLSKTDKIIDEDVTVRNTKKHKGLQTIIGVKHPFQEAMRMVPPPTAIKATHVPPTVKSTDNSTTKTPPPTSTKTAYFTPSYTAQKATHDTPTTKTSPPTTDASPTKTPQLTAHMTAYITPAAEISSPASPAKIPPPVATKPANPAEEFPEAEFPPHAAPAKIPPPVAAKTASATPSAEFPPPPAAPANIPPLVATKPANPLEDLPLKRTREQSPSCKASMARASFFSGIISPPPKVAPKTTKVTLVASTPKQETPAEQTEDAQKSTGKQEKSAEKSENVVHPQQQSQVKDECAKILTTEPREVAKESETAPEALAEVQSNDWLEKIEELSPPGLAQEQSTDDVTSEHDSAAARPGSTTSRQTAKYPTHENLMTAIHKSKRVTLSGNAANSSPPSSPGTNDGPFTYRTNGNNNSPGNSLERKRNGRFNGHRNGVSRRSTGGTSRDNFKALLLQNACRGGVGSQMTAAEKLHLNKPQQSAAAALSRQRPMSVNDANEEEPLDVAYESSENARPVISLNDIRSAITLGSTSRIGRSNIRGPRPINTEPKYASVSFQAKKHPPPSMSNKYNTRSMTPTRPMVSIDEDTETEKSLNPERRNDEQISGRNSTEKV